MNRIWIVCLCTLFACGGGRDAPKPAVVVIPQDTTCDIPAVCDITVTECQAAVLKLTACVRGDDDVPLPPMRVITTDQFRSELVDELMKEGVGGSPDDAAQDAALAALHLLPSGMSSIDAAVDAQVADVVAFYDDDTQSVTVISRTDISDPRESMDELSHELTHYLQDQAVGLKALEAMFPSSDDGQVAARSLIEGEAVVNSTRALAWIENIDPVHLVWSSLYDSIDQSLFDSVNMTDSRLASSALLVPYAIGTRFVGDAWSRYDRAHVDALFDSAPHSVVDWLAGYREPTDDSPPSSLVQTLDCGPPEAPDGYVLEELDSFGVTGALALLAAAGTVSDYDLVSKLRGDALALYVSAGVDDIGKAPVLVAWRMRFDRAASASSFASALDSLGLEPTVDGSEIVFGAASDAQAPGFGSDAFLSCPKLEDLHPNKSGMNSMAAIKLAHHAIRSFITRR